MHRERLDIHGIMPSGMDDYLSNYGWHFSKKMCEFAVLRMEWENPDSGKKEKVPPITKEEVDSLLLKYGITLKNKIAYDYVFVANMGKADYLNSSIPNEQYLAKYIQDVVDDTDGYDGLPMTRWYADTIGKGIPVIWNDMM